MKKLNSAIIKNFIYNGSYQIFKLIIPLILTPYVSRVLGPEANGIYSYINSIVSYFVLFGNLGLETYAQLEISKEKDSPGIQSRTFWEIFCLRGILFIITLVGYGVLVFCVNNNREIYILMGIVLINQILSSGYLFQAIEDFKSITIRNFIVKLVSLLLILIIVKQENDLWKYVLILNLSETVGNIWMLICAGRRLVHFQWKISFSDLFLHLRKSINFFLPAIASTIMVYIDKVMLGSMLNDNYQNGIYSQPEKIYQLILTIISAMIIVVRPRLSYAWNSKKEEQFENNTKIMFQVNLMIVIPIAIELFLTSPFFTVWFFGHEYYDSIKILAVFSIVCIIRAFSLCFFEILMITNRMKAYRNVLFGGMFINILGNYFLIPAFQALGAAYATFLSEVVMLLGLILLNRNTVSIIKCVKWIYKYILSAAVITIISELIIKLIGLNNFFDFFFVILGGITGYCISLYLVKDSICYVGINKVLGGRK